MSLFRWSKSHHFTLRDAPQDAEIPSHKLMARAGLIKKVAPGIYTYGTLGLRAIRRFEAIIRGELDRAGCQEVLMPMVHPKELWVETNRWREMGDGLLKFKNRNGHEFCLGATHEEVITDYVRNDIKSYRNLPVNLYQIQTKYRDEIRPRFGLMRGREFTMKDAYSFDADREGALQSYQKMYEAYRAIFSRLGLEFRIVQADAGNIGGSQTHEFQVLAAAGEDSLMACDTCSYAANLEVAPVIGAGTQKSGENTVFESAKQKPAEEFSTPGLRTIAQLAKATGRSEHDLVKTMFFTRSDERATEKRLTAAFAVLLRGDSEVNLVKLKNALGLSNPPDLLTDQEVLSVTGAQPGSCGPVGLKIPVYQDQDLLGHTDMIVGANRDDFHLKHVEAGRDFKSAGTFDLRLARVDDLCPQCHVEGRSGRYRAIRGIEVGHVFYLGTKYSTAMNATFLDAKGTSQPIEMGCYGIGVTRTVQAAIEQSHDADGIIWPLAIAPYDVHVALLDPTDEEVRQTAEVLCRELDSRGLDVLLDDRDERPGAKFKDADLIGLPFRINIGGRGLKEGIVEILRRKTKEVAKVPVESATEKLMELRAQQIQSGENHSAVSPVGER